MMKRTFTDADMMVGVLRRRRPVLTAWLLLWACSACWLAIGGFFLNELLYFAFAAMAMALIYFLRIVRLNKRLEELE